MREMSENDISELAEDFNIEIKDTELDRVQEEVNSNLESLRDIINFPLERKRGNFDARIWTEPEVDPYNAISTSCKVPPLDSGYLNGTSIGIKDIISVAGVPMQCGSGVMQGFVPQSDATVVKRLLNVGGEVTAKTNLDELAGSGIGDSYKGQLLNPHDKSRNPGGSSGGSAIAVATDEVDVALGTDTGGSIRIPASNCGTVGFKPTYGLVPLSGVVENTYTLDNVGPITNTVDEAAQVLEAIAGRDKRDPASMQAAGSEEYRVGNYCDSVRSSPPLSDLKIGVIKEGLGDGNADEEIHGLIYDQTEQTIQRLEDEGATISYFSSELFEIAADVKWVIQYSELASHWRDAGSPYRRGGIVNDGYQFDFACRTRTLSAELNPHYKGRLLAGAGIIENNLGRAYNRALAAKSIIQEKWEKYTSEYDILLTPTLPNLPTKLSSLDDPEFNLSRNVVVPNITEMPAITLPYGTVQDLPVGIQLIGERFGESELLAIASEIEGL